MKRTRIRLLATMITLAAVTTIGTFPASAQRRSTGRQATKSSVKTENSRKSITPQKNTYKANTKTRRAPRNIAVTSNKSIKRAPSSSTNRNKDNGSQTYSSQRKTYSSNEKSTSTRSGKPQSWDNFKERSTFRNSNNDNTKTTGSNQSTYASQRKSSSNSGQALSNSTNSGRYKTSTSASGRRETVKYADNRTRYGLNKNDKRYTPNLDYKGSNTKWSHRYRPNKMNYHYNSPKYYKNFNYYNHSHWDRQWERYNWNCNSWIDYYNGYHPHSYIYHNNYYHHYLYGHVIRRFNQNPYVFVHNHNRYYCYNGHFFRYRRGIGYILADMPFGFTFEYLPNGYERVYINGYLYFRVGNLFFEYTNQRFHLVHYPERYMAYDNSYRIEGYHFDDY